MSAIRKRSSRFHYLRRVFASYLTRDNSQLTFWHERPEVNAAAPLTRIGAYYQVFASKADYPGPFDDQGIPLLDYHGRIGRQYNPIAIAQYGLANYNRFLSTGNDERKARLLNVADWLATNLEQNRAGLWVWQHKFDWEYRDTLRAPWYSGLAQGQGISLLVRAAQETGDSAYIHAAERAFEPMLRDVDNGGVLFRDHNDDWWIEEYIVSPPTHILNGFLWALWGIWDYYLATQNSSARDLFNRCIGTIVRNLPRYDCGFWSLYEQSGTRMKMMASPFYHRLHICQLQATYAITGEETFHRYAERWQRYCDNSLHRHRALAYKSVFKLLYY